MTGTAAIIIINMIFKQLPMVTKLTAASLAQLNSRVEDAARDLGAGRFHVTKDIVLPNLRRTFVTGFYIQFLQLHDDGGSSGVSNKRTPQAGSLYAV